jgi:simple sugar transport system permease protein
VGDVTATTVDPRSTEVIRTPGEIRRARILGFVYLGLAAVVLLVFTFGTEGDFTWGLARATDPSFPDFTASAQGFTVLIAAILGVMGGVQLARGYGKWTNMVLAIGFVLFILAFMAWATAGSPTGSFSMVGMLRETLLRSVPITIGALAGILSERVAIINISIEGMLLGGAFVAVIVGSVVSDGGPQILGAPLSGWVGIGAAMITGAILAWVLAVLSIKYLVDQIITGVVINIFVLGLTSFLTIRVLAENSELNSAPIFRPLAIPGLSEIPVLGPVLFTQNIFVYAMFILVALVTFGLFRTRWGLRARSVGEHPKAADTVGINVFRTRYVSVIFGGLVAGFGGAYFTLGSVGRFDENMTAGRGFIALAAMIFGRWHPVGALSAGLLFGFADALQGKLGILQTGIPSEFLSTAPYLATILVVAGLVGKARPPAADGQPYVKE